MCSLNIRKGIYIFIIAVASMTLFGCFGSDGGATTPPPLPTVTTWDDLIWDDGSNDPNTLWED